MDRDFVTRLGLELRRRQMKKHLEQLRLYWRGAGDWDDRFVGHLGAVLQLAPFERTLPVHQDDGFTCCLGSTFTAVCLDDRLVTRCAHCKREWLSFHRSVAESVRERAALNVSTY